MIHYTFNSHLFTIMILWWTIVFATAGTTTARPTTTLAKMHVNTQINFKDLSPASGYLYKLTSYLYIHPLTWKTISTYPYM